MWSQREVVSPLSEAVNKSSLDVQVHSLRVHPCSKPFDSIHSDSHRSIGGASPDMTGVFHDGSAVGADVCVAFAPSE